MKGRLVCFKCAHFDKGPKGAICVAFPDGIPWKEMMRKQEQHAKPMKGQVGDTVFTPETRETVQ